MSSVYVDMTRKKQMGHIAQEEYDLMAEKSRLEILKDLLLLEWEDIVVSSTIGYGGFSQVFKVQIAKPIDGEIDGEDYALKCLSPTTMSRTKSFKTGAVDLALEANVLSRLSHPNVIKLHAVYAHGSRSAYLDAERGFFLVLDLLADTLRNKIDKYRLQNPQKSYSGLGMRESAKANSSTVLERIKSIGVGVARGMEYLHKEGVLLRDLKPDNVGFDHDGIPKIFDLGFAREYHTLKPKEVAGSLRYMAPEIALGRPTQYESDVYSFGVLLWEMVTLEKPYKHIQDREEFIESVMIGGWRPSTSAFPSSSLRKLVKECWDNNPTHRPDFTRVLKVLKIETSLVSSSSRKGGSMGMPLPRTATFADTSGLTRKNSLSGLSSFKKMSNASFSLFKGRNKGSQASMSRSSNSGSEDELPAPNSKNATFGSRGRTTKLNPRLASSLLGGPVSSPSFKNKRLSKGSKSNFSTADHMGEETVTLNDTPTMGLFKAKKTGRFFRNKQFGSSPNLYED